MDAVSKMGFQDSLAKEVAALSAPKPASRKESTLYTPQEIAKIHATALAIKPELLKYALIFLNYTFQITKEDLDSLSFLNPSDSPMWHYSRRLGKQAWFLVRVKGIPHDLYLRTRTWDSKFSYIFHCGSPVALYCSKITDPDLTAECGVPLDGPLDPWQGTIVISKVATLAKLSQIPSES